MCVNASVDLAEGAKVKTQCVAKRKSGYQPREIHLCG